MDQLIAGDAASFLRCPIRQLLGEDSLVTLELEEELGAVEVSTRSPCDIAVLGRMPSEVSEVRLWAVEEDVAGFAVPESRWTINVGPPGYPLQVTEDVVLDFHILWVSTSGKAVLEATIGGPGA